MRAQNRTLTLRPLPRGLPRVVAGARRITACALTAALACLLLSHPAARADEATSTHPEVRVTTNLGSFVIELRPDRAPLTVADFLHYVKSGFYNNTLFHRVVANFVIQGGGHDATPPYALKPTDAPVNNESGNGLQNKRGSVGLARASGPDTGNSQFYINLVDNPELDPLPTRWGYAVFGKVVQGMDVVDKIGVVPTGSFGPFKSDAPLTPVIIQSIDVITPPQLSSPSGTPPAAAPAGTPPSSSSASGSPAAGSSSSGSPASGSAPSGSPPSGTATSGSPQTPPGKGAAPSGSGSSGDSKSPPPAASAPGGQASGKTADQPSGSPASQSPAGESDQPDGSAGQ